MYNNISPKQLLLYIWRDIPEFSHCETFIGTGAIRTGKTEIMSKGYRRDAIKLTANTPHDYRTKGYNLYTIVSVSKSLALLNIIEPMIDDLLRKGYKEVEKTRPFYKSKKNVFVHTTSPMGMLQVKDNEGNITRFLYVGADNKRALNRVTGLTMRGWFLDEAPLVGGTEEDNITFIESMYERTATFRTEPYGRPLQVMTTNPQTDEDGLFYQRYIKGGWDKRIAVVSLWLLDNPIFTQDDVEYYRKLFTPAQFERKVMGRWVRDNSVSTYPKFDRTRHVVPHSEIIKHDIIELTIGLDEGQRDARAFVLTGFTRGYNKVLKLGYYYYKNSPNKAVKDINDYKVDFWTKAEQWYKEFGMPMTLYYDSAAKYIVEPFKRHQIKHDIRVPMVIKPVNKKATLSTIKGKNSAIKERINFTNMLFGIDAVEISDRCDMLIKAYSNCINKDGMRIDDGKTNLVDLLDPSEYGEKHRLKLIQNKLTVRGQMNG